MNKRAMRRRVLDTLLSYRKQFEPFQRQPYTCVKMELEYQGHLFTGIGFSKVCWPDVWTPGYGEQVAYDRAIKDIVHQIVELQAAGELDAPQLAAEPAPGASVA